MQQIPTNKKFMPLESRLEHYRKTYQLHLARLREELGDEDKAIAATVGGEFEVFGRIECDLLTSLGLGKDQSVIDVGCGCGRLSYYLRDYSAAKYTGIDVIPELVAYARRRANRSDWDFLVGDGICIPEGVAPADCICFFSVLTHLTLEDCYRYLADASRFLTPDGFIVFSFLDFTMPDHWPHFESSLSNQTDDSVVLQYLSRDTVVSWAAKLGLKVCGILDSDLLKIPISTPLKWTNGNITTGTINLGQSVAVLGRNADSVPRQVFVRLGDFPENQSARTYSEMLVSERAARAAAEEQLAKATSRDAASALQRPAGSSSLANFSTRGKISNGVAPMPAGFSLFPKDGVREVLVRGIGPSLAGFGVADPLQSLTLTLIDSQGRVVAKNSNWSVSPDRTRIEAARALTGAFPLAPGSADAAVVLSLSPGNYSVQIAGIDGATGEFLLEIYGVPAGVDS